MKMNLKHTRPEMGRARSLRQEQLTEVLSVQVISLVNTDQVDTRHSLPPRAVVCAWLCDVRTLGIFVICAGSFIFGRESVRARAAFVIEELFQMLHKILKILSNSQIRDRLKCIFC